MRHGQADNNVNKILVGRHRESHLTDWGRQQVEDTARNLKNVLIEKIYVSPVTRALETARIVSELTGITYEIDERLYEIEIGNLVGMNYEEIVEKYGNFFLKFYAEADNALLECGVESFTSVKRRIRDLLDEIVETQSEKNVLMITHLDPIKAAISNLLDLKPEDLYQWQIRNASLTILKHESRIYSLCGVNVMSMHRYVND
ncbi:MAG TPA: histidine phosphatase family protein [Candidatus Nitrosopolaris sp.]|nr:histidine phosphatase family protein [Candidatus Nitrosopolaris sp.]